MPRSNYGQISCGLLRRHRDPWKGSGIPQGTSSGACLVAILDLAGLRIVGRSMSERISADLVCQALRSICWQRKPAPGLLHFDRGCQCTSRACRKLAADFKMNVSPPVGRPGSRYRGATPASARPACRRRARAPRRVRSRSRDPRCEWFPAGAR